jgi:predicted flap endonuclease-1-like 5' DNA nuclease
MKPAQFTVCLLLMAGAWVLLIRRVDPVPTWFYVFAWYPTLGLLDAVAGARGRRSSLLARPAALASLLAWSPVVWLAFEAFNFRLWNWYYVALPAHPVERWAGIVLSFATVLPAIALAERALAARGLFTRGGGRTVLVRAGDLRAAVWLGFVALALVLVRPTLFFPLVWGVGLFLAEPLAYRRAPELSLIRDLERGDWGRVGRLLVGGMGIGFLWEFYNHWAEGRWIYTVPWLERIKLFEMPPLGFVGFPVFALSAWAMYAALCGLGVAIPPSGQARLRLRRVVPAGILGAVFAGVVLWGMDQRTVSSTVPRLDDLPGLTAADRTALRGAGVATVRTLAGLDATETAPATGLRPARMDEAIRAARLAMLRGMGTGHARTLAALGIRGPCDLAERDPEPLAAAARRLGRRVRPTAAEVRVWQAAASRECGAAAGAE